MGDELARQPITADALEKRVIDPLIGLPDPDLGKIARSNREKTKESILSIFHGNGPAGDTAGNSPGTKWCAWNAVAEHADWCRRYTKRTDQVQRSFEDQDIKEKALKLVVAA
jgi:hypothetical protein